MLNHSSNLIGLQRCGFVKKANRWGKLINFLKRNEAYIAVGTSGALGSGVGFYWGNKAKEHELGEEYQQAMDEVTRAFLAYEEAAKRNLEEAKNYIRTANKYNNAIKEYDRMYNEARETVDLLKNGAEPSPEFRNRIGQMFQTWKDNNVDLSKITTTPGQQPTPEQNKGSWFDSAYNFVKDHPVATTGTAALLGALGIGILYNSRNKKNKKKEKTTITDSED